MKSAIAKRKLLCREEHTTQILQIDGGRGWEAVVDTCSYLLWSKSRRMLLFVPSLMGLGAHPGVSQCSPELLSLLLCSEDSYTLYNQKHGVIFKGNGIGLKSIMNEKKCLKMF